jgi:PelA/Pel-15E family pectate lyase
MTKTCHTQKIARTAVLVLFVAAASLTVSCASTREAAFSTEDAAHSAGPAQPVNPALAEIDGYLNWITGDPAADVAFADNMISWQLDSGGFAKAMSKNYTRAWDGTSPRSEWISNGPINGRVELATIDNDATITEACFLAYMYGKTGNDAYRQALERAFDFLARLQTPNGGFAQVWPIRENLAYSNMVTFNDNAMIRVLVFYDRAIAGETPFDNNSVSKARKASLQEGKERAIDFILKSQIINDGTPTVWCAQHDPVTYEPVKARAYELPSKSGRESVLVTAYLMAQKRTPEIDRAVNGALGWFRKNAAHLVFNNQGPVFFTEDPESTIWYRFYDIDTDVPFFCGRDGIKKYDISEIEEERRLGYSWAGIWPQVLLDYADSVGR